MGPTIHILLPVHNRRAITERFVACLARQTWKDFHLVLIDDGSTDGTADAVCAVLPTTTVLRGRGDWWWGGSLDQGISWLKAASIAEDDLILFINDDLTIAADYLARAVEVMRVRPRTFVLSQCASPVDGCPEDTAQHIDLRRMHFRAPGPRDEVNCLSTQGLFAHWRDVRAVGGFHPTLLPHYLSDYEYTIRAHRMGFRCETSAELVIDLNRETTGFHQVSELHFGTFLKKYFSLKSPANPIYFTTFAWMVCPRAYVVPIVLRIWRDAVRAIGRALKGAMRTTRASTIRP